MYLMSLCTVALQFSFTGKACSSMTTLLCTMQGLKKKMWFVKPEAERLDWPAQTPDLKPTQHLWDELECWSLPRSFNPSPVSDLTNTLVAERTQISTATFQNLAESLPRRAELITTAAWGLHSEGDVQRAHMGVVVRCPLTYYAPCCIEF